MTWLAVAVGGSALVGAGASYLGSKKQAGAARDAAGLNMQMFERLNAQQQPYIQSGYNAMGRLNTLLGLGGGATAANQGSYRQPGNMRALPIKQNPQTMGMGGIAQSQNLRNLLALRAQNGDTEAARIFSMTG